MRVPGCALWLAGRVLHLAHLVQVDERVQLGEIDPRERAPDRETLALEAARGARDAAHRPLAGHDRVRFRDSRQDGDVVDGDGRHGERFLFERCRTIARATKSVKPRDGDHG